MLEHRDGTMRQSYERFHINICSKNQLFEKKNTLDVVINEFSLSTSQLQDFLASSMSTSVLIMGYAVQLN